MKAPAEIMQEDNVVILGYKSLKEEQLRTIIGSMEQRLNNRHLKASGSDAVDLEALTSTHFLLGRSTIDYPNVAFNGGSAAMKKAFSAHSQYMKNIWDNWMKKFLPQLTG